MAKKILFIGGTRFFGKLIVRELLDKGHGVTVLTRGRQPTIGRRTNFHHIQCDRQDGAALESALGGQEFDAVIDNVCYLPADAEQAVKIFSGRCRRYIFTSSVMSYLNLPLTKRPVTEQDWASARSTSGLEQQYEAKELEYAQNKRESEQIILEATEFKPIIFRLHNVVGKNDFSGKSRLLAKRLCNDDGNIRMVGSSGDLYQQVFADDLALIYCRATDLPTNTLADAYNVAAPAITVIDYIKLLGAALGTGSAVDFLNDDGEGVLARGVPYPKNIVLDCSLLQQDFKFTFTGYEDFLPYIANQ